MKLVNVLLFDNFTTLDALGPAEVFSRLKDIYEIKYFSMDGGSVSSSTGARVDTIKIDPIPISDILLIPGGFGTRQLVNDSNFLKTLSSLVTKSEYVLSVCTGSALLAKAGCIDHKKATSNKMSWDWIIAQSTKVDWIRHARWVVDGNFYSSSGITAGIDMALGFVADKHGYETAKTISKSLEYIWQENKEIDPFA